MGCTAETFPNSGTIRLIRTLSGLFGIFVAALFFTAKALSLLKMSLGASAFHSSSFLPHFCFLPTEGPQELDTGFRTPCVTSCQKVIVADEKEMYSFIQERAGFG